MRKRSSTQVKASWKAAFADWFTTVSAAVLTACGALLVEDAIPKPEDDATVVPGRLIFASVALVAVLAGLWLRQWVRATSGTLVSVQVLDEGMGDRTTAEESRKLAQREAMSIRVAHRWADLQGSLAEGVYDMSGLAAEVGKDADLLINTAEEDERITIAPNLLWPIALAVGGRLPLAEFNTWLAELSTDGRPNVEFELDKEDLWRATPPPADPVLLDEPTGERVGVSINLTSPEPAPTDPLLPFGVREVYCLSVPERLVGTCRINDVESFHLGSVALRELSRDVAVQLNNIKHGCGDRELVVTARMHKTVAVAAGWYLAQFKCRFFAGTHLLHWAGPQTPTRPMRVQQAQPSRSPRTS